MSDKSAFKKELRGLTNFAVNVFPIFFSTKENIGFFSLFGYRIENDLAGRQFNKELRIEDDRYEIKTLLKKGLRVFKSKSYSYYANFHIIKIKKNAVKGYRIQNPIFLNYSNDGTEIEMPVAYNAIYLNKGFGHSSRAFKTDTDLVYYFRQTKENAMALTVREKNITDLLGKRFLIFLAWVCSPFFKHKKYILLYEKEAKKYEESASNLFELMIDEGYKQVFYVLSENSPHIKHIKQTYREKILWSHTFRHYLYYFAANAYVGSESVSHALELRTKSSFVIRRMLRKRFRYIFLQHGVMYMVSLDSNFRSFFKKGSEMPDGSKIIVSSHKEADHFVELGGFEYDDLYLTGLPAFDRITKKTDADNITLMITWRPWDYNTMLSSFKSSSYYKFVKKIYDNIDKKYHGKINILPHPLVYDNFSKTDLGKYIIKDRTYDEVLEETDLLITDYSSIAYSAFYRGSKVVFCWEELDICMDYYDGHLMLNQANVFGDICYDVSNINEVLDLNYLHPQKDQHITNFREIVEFHDKKNTERVLDMMIQDGFVGKKGNS